MSIFFSRHATVSGIANAAQTQRANIASDVGGYSSTEWSVRYPAPAEQSSSNLTPHWRMVDGKFEWGGYINSTTTGSLDCLTLSNVTALPHFADVGQTLPLGTCTVGKASPAFAGSLGNPSSWTVEVKASLAPGKVLVCLQGACYRGDRDGNLDASKTPWEAETEAPASSAPPINWPVSLIIARGLSIPFDECQPRTFPDGSVEPCYSSVIQRVMTTARGGETGFTRQAGGVGGSTTYWHMDEGRFVWDGFISGNSGGGQDCRTVLEQPALPLFATIGQTALAGRCRSSSLPPGNPPTTQVLQSSWKVIPSVQPGKVQVCLMGAEFSEYCFRADEAGNVDPTKFPWLSESEATASSASLTLAPEAVQWPVSLILARAYSQYFKQCFPNGARTDSCASSSEQEVRTTATGGVTAISNSSFPASRSIEWEMENGHLVIIASTTIAATSRTLCNEVKTRVLTPYYAVIGERGLSSKLGCSYTGAFPPTTPVEWTNQWSVQTSKKPGHVLVCDNFAGCYRADQSGNIDITKTPFVAE